MVFPLPTADFTVPLADKLQANEVGPRAETVIKRNRKAQELSDAQDRINAENEARRQREGTKQWKFITEWIKQQVIDRQALIGETVDEEET